MERALQHIEEHRALVQELGGAIDDVEQYFFSLSPTQLKIVLDEYEELYSEKARSYAEETLPKWKKRSVKMSGQTADRLFRLLPNHMTIATKLELTESLWGHLAPQSRCKLYVSPDVEFDQLQAEIRTRMEVSKGSYKFPIGLKKRFEWLSGGDVQVEEELLNFVLDKERKLSEESLLLNLPILQTHLNSDRGQHTHHLSHEVNFGKNRFTVEVTDGVEGITENPPRTNVNRETEWSWVWWVLLLLGLVWVAS